MIFFTKKCILPSREMCDVTPPDSVHLEVEAPVAPLWGDTILVAALVAFGPLQVDTMNWAPHF